MSQRELIGKILRVLQAADEAPMPESGLISATQVLARPDQPTIGDVVEALKSAQAKQFVAGASDDLTETWYVLTTKGKLKARQL